MREPRRAPCVLPPSQVHTGQARIRPPRCQGKNNKWPQMEREHMTIQQWGEKWAKNKKQMKGLEKEDPDVPLGMWAMLKPFPSNQHHVSAEPYYPINELYWGNKVLRISANTLKGPRAATPERLMKKKKKKKRGSRLASTVPAPSSWADRTLLRNSLLVSQTELPRQWSKLFDWPDLGNCPQKEGRKDTGNNKVGK